MRTPPVALLLDLDGVLRPADPAHRAQVMDTVREVRAAGRPVALVTGPTEEADAELAGWRQAGWWDAVVNSGTERAAKPSGDFFAMACAALGVPAARVLFVDDSDRCVRGARAAGLAAHRYTGPADLRYLRAALLIDPPASARIPT